MQAPRPFGIQLLAALLATYAMAGVFLALTIREAAAAGRMDWRWIVAGSAAFAISAGAAALSVWRLESRAPALVAACGILGAALCLLLPLSAPSEQASRVWMPAVLGAVLFLAFLLLAAFYVGRQVRRD